MKNRMLLLVGLAVMAVLLARMVIYQVRFDEVAVVTTFGRAGSSSVKTDSGAYLRLPPPIQQVTKYSTLDQLLEDELEEVSTRDHHVVIVKTFLVWKIEDPLVFMQNVGSVDDARLRLTRMVRDVRGVFSQYDFDAMVNPDPKKIMLEQMESEATDLIAASVAGDGMGLSVQRLGIRRILVPEKVTEKVFERMKQERERLAESAKASGEAKARSITAKATQIKAQILAFADRFAGAIRLEGDKEAAQYLTQFKKDPELATFLRWTEALENMLKHRTTFVLSTEQVLSPNHLLGAHEHALTTGATSNSER